MNACKTTLGCFLGIITLTLAIPNHAHGAVANVAWLQGNQVPGGSSLLNFPDPRPIQFNSRSSIDPTVFAHDIGADPGTLIVQQDGDYLAAATMPVTSVHDADDRFMQATEIYVNGSPVAGGLGQSSYIRNQPRNANMQREGSNHAHTLLAGLKAGDEIEVRAHKYGTSVGLATRIDMASLYVERLDASRTVFGGVSDGPSDKPNLYRNLDEEDAAQIPWDSVRKDSGFTHSDGSNTIGLSSGTYAVFVNIPLSGATVRANVALRVYLDGTQLDGGVADMGYIRNASGHTMSSIHWSGWVQVNGSSQLSIETEMRSGAAGTVTLPSGKQASIYVEKLDTSSGVFASGSLDLETSDNWNPAVKDAIAWDPATVDDSNVYNQSSGSITVRQAGSYLLIYNDALEGGNARVNPKITVEVNGVPQPGAETKAHYIRQASGHAHSSGSLVFLLEGLSANDVITVSVQREGNTAAVLPDFEIEPALLTLIKKADFVPAAGDTSAPRTVSFTGDVFGFNAQIDEFLVPVDESSVQVSLNGEAVAASVNKQGSSTMISFDYTSPDFPPTGSVQEVTVAYSDGSQNYEVDLAYSIITAFSSIPSSFATEADTTKPGFIVNTSQVSTDQSGVANLHGNRIDRAEMQLAGEILDANGDPYLNEAGPSAANSWEVTPIEVETVVNWEQEGNEIGADNFDGNVLIPGIPGWNGAIDGIALEILTYLELEPGFHTLIVNSDDGFLATFGASPSDKVTAIPAGLFDGGRGAGDTPFNVVISEAGFYPFRVLYFEGGGGASIEIMSLHEGEKILLNDRSNPNAIKAYREGTSRPYLLSATPASGQLAQELTLELIDGSLTVVDGSVSLNLDGQDVAADVSKSGDITTIVYDVDPGGDAYFSGGDHVAVVSYEESTTPPTPRSIEYSFSTPKGQITVLLDEPVLYWRLGETSGGLAVNEVNVNLDGAYETATPGGPPPGLGADRLVVGDASTAVRFDRSQGHLVRAPDHPDINVTSGPWRYRSVEVWFNAATLPPAGERYFVYEEGGGTRGLAIYIEDGELRYHGWNIAEQSWGGTADPIMVVAPNIQPNTTYHAVMVMEGEDPAIQDFSGTLSGYLNGELVDSVEGVHLLYNHGDDLALGGVGQNSYLPDLGVHTCTNCDNFDGTIDEFAVYNSALSADRVAEHYRAGNEEVPLELEPFARLSPSPNAMGVAADADIFIELVEGTGSIDENSVSLSLNGAAVTPDVSSAAGVITVIYMNPDLYAADSDNMVELSYTANGVVVNESWSFTVFDYLELDCAVGTELGSAATRGFNYRIHQSNVAQPNTTARAEDQIAGLLGQNFANPTSGTVDIVNFDQDAGGIGNFSPDSDIPGIPGDLPGNTDNIAAEFSGFVEFTEAGWYGMGVNSDDGFEVSVTESDRDAPVVGVFEGGRGAADTIFGFVVPVPGVYPMRLLWYEGTGGANVEWFTILPDGTKVLMNDTDNGGVAVYQQRFDQPLNCEGEPDVDLDISLLGDGSVQVTYSAGTLHESDSPTGTFTPVAGATSPYVIQPDQGQKYYLVRVP